VNKKRGPYSSPRQQDRRERILRAAVELLEQHGLAALTMPSIALSSDVSTKTLYNLFETRDLLVLEAASERLANLEQSEAVLGCEPGLPRLLGFTAGAMQQFEKMPVNARTVISILVRADLDYATAYERLGPVQRVAHASLCTADELGELRAGLDLTELSYLVASNQWGVVLLWEKGLLKLEQLETQVSLSHYLTLTPLCLGKRRQSMEANMNELLDRLAPATAAMPPMENSASS
jgi:AcrR family transcriptional regulator